MQRQKGFLARAYNHYRPVLMPVGMIGGIACALGGFITLVIYADAEETRKRQETQAEHTEEVKRKFNLQFVATEEDFADMTPGFYVLPNQMIDGEERDCMFQISRVNGVSLDCN